MEWPQFVIISSLVYYKILNSSTLQLLSLSLVSECLRKEFRVTMNILRTAVSGDMYEVVKFINLWQIHFNHLFKYSDVATRITFNLCNDAMYLSKHAGYQRVSKLLPLTKIMLQRFIDKLKQEIHGKGVKRQLVVLYNIYALSLLHKHQGEILTTSSITAKQASLATAQLRNLYSQVATFYF